MSRPRRCPHCGKRMPIHHGYTFDQDLTLRCDHCKKVVFPATPAAEMEKTNPTTTPPPTEGEEHS